MKYALVTVATQKLYKDIAKLTHPTFKKYADKIGADFICIDEAMSNFNTDKWLKFNLFNILQKYDRVLYVDTDIIIREDSPNIFELVPYEELGIFNEGRYEPRQHYLQEARIAYKEELKKWTNDFYNTGVMVLSKHHRKIFVRPENASDTFDEQSYLNLRINNDGIKVKEISYKFNRMSFMDKKIGITRFDSYFIHYAGAPPNAILEFIKNDIELLKKSAPKYEFKHNIQVFVSAGMGDQIASEPAIRYLIEHEYKGANIEIYTHHPSFFRHLEEKYGVPVKTYEENKGLPESTMILYTCPEDDKNETGLSHIHFHPTDYASINMFKKIIPIENKNLKVYLDINGIANLLKLVDLEHIKRMVLIHPGKGWESKTFPVEWWQTVIDGANEFALLNGYYIGIIGAYLNKEQGYVDVVCPEGAYDFRDSLDHPTLTGLISQAPVLLTNDSSPLHIAGGFDNEIVIIPTCKHEEHILPWRKNSQYHKAHVLRRDLIVDYLDTRSISHNPNSIDKLPEGHTWNEFLPETTDVINKVNEILKKLNSNAPENDITKSVN